MSNREEWLDDPFPAMAPVLKEGSYIPDWLSREAGMEEDWEKVEKKRLELSALARNFKTIFPAERFGGVFGVDRLSGQKIKIKDASEVFAEAFKWVKDKTEGDIAKSREILNMANLTDEQITSILFHYKKNSDEKATDHGEKLVKERESFEDDPAQPHEVLRRTQTENYTVEEVIEEHQENVLERKASIGKYAVIADDIKTQIWKKGSLLQDIYTEELGGFAVIAEEIGNLETEKDVETLFNLQADKPAPEVPDSSFKLPSTFKPKAEKSQVASSFKIGTHVAFRSGSVAKFGKLVSVHGDTGNVRIAGNMVAQVPLSRLVATSGACCEKSIRSAHKFCAGCGVKLADIVDNPSYQRNDEMKGDSGEFDPEHPVDMKTHEDVVDPGPASLVPGTTEISPDIPGQDSNRRIFTNP